jgi:twitching motility protein PilT
MAKIDKILEAMLANEASDVHLSSGMPVLFRIHGDITQVTKDPLSNAHIGQYLQEITTEPQRKRLAENRELDLAYEMKGKARFRVNVFFQERGLGTVIRHIPSEILSLGDLKAPKIFNSFPDYTAGLILVTGQTGSGKSTTLAAIINEINTTQEKHIITIEDPLEFVHQNSRSLVSHREVGTHTRSFGRALRSAVREDPDVILVGEMRDLETIRLAISAATYGILVFGTLHTNSAAKSIDRIIQAYPAEEQKLVRNMLSESLRAVIAQTLCKTKGGRRVAAHEIMIATPAISNLIREGKVNMVQASMENGRNYGMITLDQCLMNLVKTGKIPRQEAYQKAHVKDLFTNETLDKPQSA